MSLVIFDYIFIDNFLEIAKSEIDSNLFFDSEYAELEQNNGTSMAQAIITYSENQFDKLRDDLIAMLFDLQTNEMNNSTKGPVLIRLSKMFPVKDIELFCDFFSLTKYEQKKQSLELFRKEISVFFTSIKKWIASAFNITCFTSGIKNNSEKDALMWSITSVTANVVSDAIKTIESNDKYIFSSYKNLNLENGYVLQYLNRQRELLIDKLNLFISSKEFDLKKNETKSEIQKILCSQFKLDDVQEIDQLLYEIELEKQAFIKPFYQWGRMERYFAEYISNIHSNMCNAVLHVIGNRQ